jgi:outer membrane protein assembly factor BamB
MRYLSKSIIYFILLLVLLIIASCSSETNEESLFEDIKTNDANDLFNADPSLNNFVITRWDESVVIVNPETGSEEIVYTFDDFIYPEGVANYYNGVIYVSTDDNAINAINLETKSFLWDVPMLEYDFSSLGFTSINIKDGICYASGSFGVMVAVDAISGELLWYYSSNINGELDNLLTENRIPIVHEDKVYLFSEIPFASSIPPYMHILDKNTGKLINKIELPYETTGEPVINNDIMYLPAKNMYAIDLNSLEVVWSFEADAVSTPQISADKIVFHGIPVDDTIYSNLYCSDVNTGTPLWIIETGFDTMWTPTIVNDVVFGVYEKASSFAFARNGRPFAVNLNDGSQIWYQEDISIDTSPVYANGRLFFHGHNITVTSDIDDNVGFFSMNASTGEILWLNNTFRYDYISTPIVVAQNGIFGPGYYQGN